MSLPLAVQLHAEYLSATEATEAHKKATQEFFTAYATELRAPHYGDAAKIFAEAMLVRAAEKGLYVAPKPEAS